MKMTSEQDAKYKERHNTSYIETWIANHNLGQYYNMDKIKYKIIYDKYTWLFILNDDVVKAYNLGSMYGKCYDARKKGIFDNSAKIQEWVQQLNQMM